MEKLSIVLKTSLLSLLLLFLGVNPSLSQQQTIDNTNSYLGVNFEKTPDQTEGKQTIKNERSFLFINIILNGKIKECKPENNN